MTARRVLEAAGVGMLFVLPFVWTQLSPGYKELYHHLLPLTSVAGGLLLDLLAISLLSLAAFAVIDRMRSRQQAIAWLMVCAVLSGLATRGLILLLDSFAVPLPAYALRLTIWVPLAVLTLGSVLLVDARRAGRSNYGRMLRGLRLGLAVAGCEIVVILPRLVYLASRSQPMETAGFQRRDAAPPAENRRRIIWILLDEFSYDQSFGHRQSSVLLPHFDAFAQQSTLFTEVQPVGYRTETVVPSLLVGRRVAQVRSDYNGMLSLRLANQSHWTHFSADASIFGEARRLGWSTGIAGWYNPYCRILGSVLDSCYWTFADPMRNGLSGRQPAIANALAILPLLQLASPIFHLKQEDGVSDNLHLADYQRLMAQAAALLENERIRMLMVHLPVPHPPGIYDRRSGTFRQGGTYLDNLALADRALGKVLEELRGTKSWEHTTVMVSSDHSWRVPIWRREAGWTSEEEAASQGRFDPRPLLMIHFPGQTTGDRITRPTSALAEHDMLDAMLRGEMGSAQELRSWPAQRPAGE